MQMQLSRVSKKLSRISREAVLRKGSYREFQKRRQLSQIPEKKLSRISSEVDHAMAAIANFKKNVAKDISLVAPLSRFFLPT